MTNLALPAGSYPDSVSTFAERLTRYGQQALQLAGSLQVRLERAEPGEDLTDLVGALYYLLGQVQLTNTLLSGLAHDTKPLVSAGVAVEARRYDLGLAENLTRLDRGDITALDLVRGQGTACSAQPA